MNISLDQSLIVDLPPFKGMTLEAMGDLLSAAQTERFSKGQTIFAQADEIKNFYLLLDGYIKVVKLTPDGQQVVFRYIASGELFGIGRAVGIEEYPGTAIAAADCVVLTMPDSIWNDIVSKHPTFSSNVLDTVGKRLVEAHDQVVDLATKKVERRVATAVVKLANEYGRKTDEGIFIDFLVSRKDISEMTGTTLHTVSRLLSGWENDGFIKSGREKITLIEGHKLKSIANGGTGLSSDRYGVVL